MRPSRRAATALHMYAPMLVVEVLTSRVPSAFSASVGRPVRSSVIATNDAQVPRAYSRRSASFEPPRADAVAGNNSDNAASTATNPTLIGHLPWLIGRYPCRPPQNPL